MATEPPSRIAQLPGFDTAPDVYETHNPTSTSTSSSSDEATSPGPTTSDTSSDSEDQGVSRRRLYPERARSRFGQDARTIKTRGADWSDRVDGRRRGFRRGGREAEESLGERLSRLRREVEECKVLAEKEGDEGREGDVEALGRLLAGVSVPKKQGGGEEGDEFHDANETGEDEEDMPTVKPLEKVSDFDTRLATIETALGISSTLDESTTHTPLIPTLALLDQQLATLNSATSLAALESASSRIAALKQSAQDLSDLQSTSPEDSEESTILSPDDMKHLQDLYTLLPTLTSLAPTVPALITRLRSLRTLHTTAASASADLDSIEQRQAELDRELKMWKEGLEKVESAVQDADAANGKNGSFVHSWVQDLEKRMKDLGR